MSNAERALLVDLGARLRLARKRRHLSMELLARRAGVSRMTLHRAESGDAATTLATCIRVLTVLGMERDIAHVAKNDEIGRRLQDMSLQSKPARALKVPADRVAPTRRPRTLREVAVWGRAHGDTDSFLREFLDAFYAASDASLRAAMVAEEPPIDKDERTNAYLAAVAEHLALRNGLPIPAWTERRSRFLKMPFFTGGLESLKATLLKESPPAFRRRMIFVGADPLYRPRRDAVGIGD
ncbi:MAG: helix-turn-helix transcriptional regulator [Burkholderiaceae bacterium]|nr:helix-turn-helix transcriptional regulator [Burkholderiaceae bacterium]